MEGEASCERFLGFDLLQQLLTFKILLAGSRISVQIALPKFQSSNRCVHFLPLIHTYIHEIDALPYPWLEHYPFGKNEESEIFRICLLSACGIDILAKPELH